MLFFPNRSFSFATLLCASLSLCPTPAFAQVSTSLSAQNLSPTIAIDTLVTADFPRYYRSPLDIPINLSGNYGEFRSNHFHTGYDMRVGGVVGAKLYAVADGFISRISVSSGGYGNGLYVEHPNGTTSVYGHLLDFAPIIQNYVKERQYEQRSFALDLPLTSDLFPVKQGDFIGRAGNSGASSGPHLHFEVRNTATQTTLNLTAYDLYPVTDRTPPVLNRLQLYRYSIQSGVPRVDLLKTVDLRATSTPIPVSDTFYLAIGAYDRMEGSPALLSLAQYEVYLDDVQIYKFTKHDVPANHGRYLNSFLQYSRRIEFDQTLLKTWVEPGNVLRSFVDSPSQGLFSLPDSLVHQIKIVLTDDYGNSSTHRFQVVLEDRSKEKPIYPILGKRVIWAIDNYYEYKSESESEFESESESEPGSDPPLRLYLPFGALGKNIDLCVAPLEPTPIPEITFYSPLWSVGTPSEPLLKPMRLSIYAHVPDAFKEKAIIVSVSKEATCSSAGGKWNGDYVETTTYNFGNFAVTLDTIPPRIVPRFSEGADLRHAQQLAFRISDNLSGIQSFEGYIDGAWALFVYDAKNRQLTYTFDKKRIGSGKTHALELQVTDNCNNVSMYKTNFFW